MLCLYKKEIITEFDRQSSYGRRFATQSPVLTASVHDSYLSYGLVESAQSAHQRSTAVRAFARASKCFVQLSSFFN